MQLMNCWKEEKSELHLKLIAVAILAGFVLALGALIGDFHDGANDASRAQFEELMLLEQERSG
jgi:hypothetical protein